MNSFVHLRRIRDYDLPALEEAVAEFFAPLRGYKLQRSKRVLIKPNLLGAYHPEQAVTTHPLVLEAVARYWLDQGKEVWIGDSPGGTVSVSAVWEKSGLRALAERLPVKLVNLSAYGSRELEFGGIKVRISEALWRCGIFINAAKLKTHTMMGFTGALKNLYGLVPGLIKTEYHGRYPNQLDFSALLLALYSLVRDRVTYSLIDGILGMDGAGPSAGRVRNFGVLLGSRSAPALDFVASGMMGFRLRDLPYLRMALHADGELPSRIGVDEGFRGFRLEDVDIRAVRMSSDILRFVPSIVRDFFGKAYSVRLLISDRCKRCGICVASCPKQAISPIRDGKYPRIDDTACIRCMCCHEMCPHKAIDLQKSLLAKLVMK